MNIFRNNVFGLLVVCAGLSFVNRTLADDADTKIELKVKPASCVALHKGQRCFQKMRFFWESNDGLEYCLYSDTHEQKLFCARGSDIEFVHAYASENSESFSLRLSPSGLTVATITVNTSWVYRTGKRSSSGWRLF